jgi:hypothetical protein
MHKISARVTAHVWHRITSAMFRRRVPQYSAQQHSVTISVGGRGRRGRRRGRYLDRDCRRLGSITRQRTCSRSSCCDVGSRRQSLRSFQRVGGDRNVCSSRLNTATVLLRMPLERSSTWHFGLGAAALLLFESPRLLATLCCAHKRAGCEQEKSVHALILLRRMKVHVSSKTDATVCVAAVRTRRAGTGTQQLFSAALWERSSRR